MANLSPESVEFARQHLSAYWDSDFFPRAFEFAALWAQWPQVRDYLTTTPVADLEVVLPRIMVAPKAEGGYRVVHQLDPVNAVAYAAMAHQIAQAVENARPAVADRVACSYRVSIDAPRGSFFGENNGYSDFVEQSRDLANEFTHVLTADITDFYNQIYLHRLQNAISTADSNLEPLASDIEGFLIRLNDRVSHGVPVGPSASIIMSEAVLLDVDAFILGKGFKHTRYVDDFRVFSDDVASLNQLHQDLTRYLHSSHRLVLASSKTRCRPTSDFLDTVLDDPEEAERRGIHGALTAVGPINGYESELADDVPADLPDAALERAEILQTLMDQVCAIDPIDLGLARHVLRRCRRYRIRAIVPQLLDNFAHFAPVMNDVVIYLSAVMNRGLSDRQGPKLEAIILSPPVLEMEWVRYWAAELVVRNLVLLRRPVLRDFIIQYGDLEHRADAALLLRDVAWVRAQRARIDELGSWPRRRILRAGLALARDERRNWYQNIQANHRPGIERWLLPWLLAQK
jgi:reverse transcriptase-like protein